MKRAIKICLFVFGLILSFSMVDARSSDVVPTKDQSTSWDKKISGATRFKLVLDGEAVLDRETGLVWEKSPDGSRMNWNATCSHCITREVGGRMGWRLPTIEDLASLVDTSQVDPALPAGHPFTNVQSFYYWSSSTYAGNTSGAWGVVFGNGGVGYGGKTSDGYVWCVRGGN